MCNKKVNQKVKTYYKNTKGIGKIVNRSGFHLTGRDS